MQDSYRRKPCSAIAIKSGCHWFVNLELSLKKFWVVIASCLILSTESFSMVFFQESSKPMMFPLYNLMILSQTIFSFLMKLFNSLLAFWQRTKVVLSKRSNRWLETKGNLLMNTSIMIERKIDTEANNILHDGLSQL